MNPLSIVVALGVALTVVCIVMLVLPFGAQYKTVTQTFKGWGVNLEISLLTLVLIVGVGLAMAPVAISIYADLQEIKNQLETAKREGELARGETAALREALNRAQKFDLWALVTLDGVTEATMPKPSDVESTYLVSGSADAVRAAVTRGVRANQFRIHLTGVDRQTVVQRLIVEQPGKSRWAYDGFVPLEPVIVLRREN